MPARDASFDLGLEEAVRLSSRTRRRNSGVKDSSSMARLGDFPLLNPRRKPVIRSSWRMYSRITASSRPPLESRYLRAPGAGRDPFSRFPVDTTPTSRSRLKRRKPRIQGSGAFRKNLRRLDPNTRGSALSGCGSKPSGELRRSGSELRSISSTRAGPSWYQRPPGQPARTHTRPA